jgi:flagellar hook-basal body complex protein FliE
MQIDTYLLGTTVEMKTTNPLHYTDKPSPQSSDDASASFAEMFNKSLSTVNDLQVDAEAMVQKMIYEPGSVDIHTVMIAQQKAEIALSFAKAVRDEAVRAYRELVNLR